MTDWTLVKKMTLWDYEELIEKISEVFSYDFVREHYNHDMTEAADYAVKLFGYDRKFAEQVSRLTGIFESLSESNVKDYVDLIHKVESRAKSEDFLKRTKLPFEDLIFALNYVFRWVLPHCLYLRELIDKENKTHENHVEELRSHEIRFNLDILERSRFREGRENLSRETGIPKPFILELVNLADISRLPFSNRKTVKHLQAAGYDSLAKLALTDSEKFCEDMKSYFERKGVKLSGFIDLEGIAQWTRTIPAVVED